MLWKPYAINSNNVRLIAIRYLARLENRSNESNSKLMPKTTLADSIPGTTYKFCGVEPDSIIILVLLDVLLLAVLLVDAELMPHKI